MSDNLQQAKKLIKKCLNTQNTYLDLGNCGITNLNDLPELFECKHIEILILSNKWWNFEKREWIESQNKGESNKLKILPNQIAQLQNLKTIILYDVFVIKNPDINILGKLNSLSTLYLRYNQISDINFLDKLNNLTTLYLSSNNISNISCLENLNNLRTLYLSSNNISNISCLGQLNNLRTLDLSSNNISDISCLGNLNNLRTLDLSYNNISNITCLENLNNLTTLDLRSNKISNITCLGNLNKLSTLYLSSNKISNICVLEIIRNITHLDLSNNKIIDISPLKENTHLAYLNISNNQISNISSLKKIISLNHLDSTYNRISDISALAKLTNLNNLNISDNQISNVNALAKLTNLNNLGLSDNQISNVNVLAKLTNLNNLYLSFNQISTIGYSLFQQFPNYNLEKYGKSKGLSIGSNPIISPPISILRQGKETVLSWYEAQKEALRELKVIFLGEPKAGKTSLLRRLEDNSFNEHEPQTDGVFIKALEFEQLPTFSAQKKLHGLVGYFWDFGGQEIMNATHQFFLTERSVYVLLLNAREDKNVGQQIRQWLKRIQATGGTSSVIVAVNQIDLNNGFGFENERELKREFPQIEAFIKISCKDKKHQGIEQLKNLLEQHICKTLAHFKTEIDERWLPLKAELQRVTKAECYLNQKDFERICQKHQLFVGLEQQSLIRFLHDLGFVLHFSHIDLGYYSKKVNLDDYYVLDPSWITAGVYQILTSQYAAIENGEVCMSKLAYIVNKEAEKKAAYHISDSQRLTYNSVERDFLVNILYKFKLCFYHSGGHKFIIPDLLTTKEPPPYDEIRNSRDSLQFIYHYPYLPKSVMPHIIVDMHEHLEEKWRTGCIFAYQNCRALLYSYNDEIRIIVVSDTATNHVPKRSVMDMMRFVLGNINAKLAKQPEKQIPLFDENNVEVGRAKYKALLALQKKGRKFYDFYNDFSSEMMEFEISRLLEGISSVKEINHDYRGLEDMRSILRNQKKMANNQALLLRQQIITSSNLYDLEKKL